MRYSEAVVGALDRALAKAPVWIAAIAALAVVQAWLIATHQPWRDEIQALQIAVETPDLAALLANLRYEGHPPLWFLLLRGLAHVADPLDALPLAAGLLAAVTQAAILLRAPFTRAERLLIASSQFVLFEFNTVARSLTLGVCLLVLVMVLWRSRWSWLAIALLPLTDFLFGVLSLIVLVLRWRARLLWLPGIALWLAGSLFAAWTVIPAPDFASPVEDFGTIHLLVGWANRLGVSLFPFQWSHGLEWDSLQPLPIRVFAWAALLLFFWRQTIDDRLHQRMLFAFVAFTAVFSALVYPFAARHLMLASLLLILLAWRKSEEGTGLRPGFRLWLLGASLCGVVTASWSAFEPFDTSPRVAAFIRARNLEREHWMAFPASRGQTITALTGMRFEQPDRHCLQTFIRWNHRSDIETLDEFAALLRREVALHGRFYLVSHIDFGPLPTDLIRKIGFVPEGLAGQDFRLYLVGPRAPRRPAELPPCVPGLRPFEQFAM